MRSAIKFIGILFFLGLIALALPQQACATISSPTDSCDTGNQNSQSTINCNTASNTCPTSNSVVIALVQVYGVSITGISNSGTVLTWNTAIDQPAGGGIGYELKAFWAQQVTGACSVVTTTFSGVALFSHLTVFFYTGALMTGSPIDATNGGGTAGVSFTTNAVSHTATLTTTWTGDALVTQIACNSGTVPEFVLPTGYSGRFSPTGTSYMAATRTSNATTPGSYNAVWTNVHGGGNDQCVFTGGLYGVLNLFAIKAADGAPAAAYSNDSTIIKYHSGFIPRAKKIPWDNNRKRKLKIVSI